MLLVWDMDLRLLIVHQMAHVFQADDPPTHVVLGRKLTCPLKKWWLEDNVPVEMGTVVLFGGVLCAWLLQKKIELNCYVISLCNRILKGGVVIPLIFPKVPQSPPTNP